VSDADGRGLALAVRHVLDLKEGEGASCTDNEPAELRMRGAIAAAAGVFLEHSPKQTCYKGKNLQLYCCAQDIATGS
jgi:hypothetical protein